jgi:hypothetical protein
MNSVLASSTLGTTLAERFRSVDGQRRLNRALYTIAVDVVYPQARSDLRPADFHWLLEALSEPVSSGSRAALETLLAELGPALSRPPATLVADLQSLKDRPALGLE